MDVVVRNASLLILLIAASPFAHAVAAPSKTYTFSADGTGALIVTPKQALTLIAQSDQPLVLACDAAKQVDCTQYSLSYAQKTGDSTGVALTAGASTKTGAQWVLAWAAVTKCQSGEILIAKKPKVSTTVARIAVSVPLDASCAGAPGAPAAPDVPPPTESKAVSDLVSTDCTEEINAVLAKTPANSLYDEKGNHAIFIVSPSGNMLARPKPAVDEDDAVDVWVIGDKSLLPKLTVKRSSTIRTLGALNIVGADVQVPAFLLKAKENPCDVQTYALSDFAPGKGEVTMSVAADKGTTTTGTFDFAVSTLYSGAFSLGPLYTTLKSPAYGLLSKGTGNVVTETDRGGDRVIYTLIYTPFVWGKRDLEKDSLRPMLDVTRLNPMFGIVLNDAANNALLGASYDLSSMVYLDFGVQAGKVKRLDPNSGLTIGGAFTGTGTAVPTQTQWKTGFFVGVSMDLRAAAKFFGLAAPKSQ